MCKGRCWTRRYTGLTAHGLRCPRGVDSVLPPPPACFTSPQRTENVPRAGAACTALSASLPVASGKDAARESVVGFWLSRQDLLMAWPSAVSEGDRHGVVFDLSHREN